MEYKFTNEFFKDSKRFGADSELIHLLGAKINETVGANSTDNISGIVVIRKTSVHYRFKIKTKTRVYRIGIKRIKKVIWFACIDNNKKRFYRRFP